MAELGVVRRLGTSLVKTADSDTDHSGLPNTLKTAPYLLAISLLSGIAPFFVPIAPTVLFIRFTVLALLSFVFHIIAWRIRSGALTLVLQILTPIAGVMLLSGHLDLPLLTVLQPIFVFLGVVSGLLLTSGRWLLSLSHADNESNVA